MPEGDLRFSASELNLVLHATEDEEKVFKSIQGVLLIPTERFSSLPSEGHYKNKITLYKATLSSQESGDLARRVISLLNSIDKDQLLHNLHEYSDEKGNLYLRLDKQKMCQGKVSLSENDSIRIRFKPVKRFKPSSSIEEYRGLLSSTE